MERRDSRFKHYVHALFYGGTAMAVAKTATAPLERFKIISQTQSLANIPVHDRYKGLFHYLRSVPKREGIKGYWRGNGANIYKIFPNTSFRFMWHMKIRKLIIGDKNLQGIQKLAGELFVAFTSGSISLIATYPLDIARTRLAADLCRKEYFRAYDGPIHCIKNTVNDTGIKGLYQGYFLSFGMMAPYLALTTYIYEQIKPFLENEEMIKNPIIKYLTAGSIAGILGETIIYPLDTVKRQLQVSRARGYKDGYSSTFNAIKGILANEGIKGFYRGCIINFIKSIPAIAINFAVYDFLESHQLSFDPKIAQDNL